MIKVVVSDAAHRDLLTILGDVAVAAGEKIAAFYAAEIDRLYTRLALFPESDRHVALLATTPELGSYIPT